MTKDFLLRLTEEHYGAGAFPVCGRLLEEQRLTRGGPLLPMWHCTAALRRAFGEDSVLVLGCTNDSLLAHLLGATPVNPLPPHYHCPNCHHLYRRYADEDGESTAEDVTVDSTSNPERLFFRQWQTDALFDAYENLDYRERTMVADHLGFCTECYGIYELGIDESGKPVKLLRKSKAYIDLAAEHTLSSPDTAFRIVNGAYEKMRKELTEKGIY